MLLVMEPILAECVVVNPSVLYLLLQGFPGCCKRSRPWLQQLNGERHVEKVVQPLEDWLQLGMRMRRVVLHFGDGAEKVGHAGAAGRTLSV